MIKKTLAILTMVMPVLLFGLGYAYTPEFEKINNWRNAVVKISSITTGRNLGAGVFISKNHILTVKHLAEKNETLIEYLDGTSAIGHLKWKAEDLDLALYAVEKDFNGWIPELKCKIPQIGEELVMIGHPYVASWMLQYGYAVTDIVVQTPGGPELPVDLSINLGNSGGPILDSSENLVGIAVAIYGNARMPGSGISLMLSGDEICKVLEEKGYGS